MPKAKAPARKKMGRVAEDIRAGLDEIRRHLRGEKTGIRSHPPKAPPAVRAVGELKAAREAAGLSVADVATAAGVTAAQVARLEAGKVKRPTVEVLERYAAAVGKELRLTVVDVRK